MSTLEAFALQVHYFCPKTSDMIELYLYSIIHTDYETSVHVKKFQRTGPVQISVRMNAALRCVQFYGFHGFKDVNYDDVAFRVA